MFHPRSSLDSKPSRCAKLKSKPSYRVRTNSLWETPELRDGSDSGGSAGYAIAAVAQLQLLPQGLMFHPRPSLNSKTFQVSEAQKQTQLSRADSFPVEDAGGHDGTGRDSDDSGGSAGYAIAAVAQLQLLPQGRVFHPRSSLDSKHLSRYFIKLKTSTPLPHTTSATPLRR